MKKLFLHLITPIFILYSCRNNKEEKQIKSLTIYVSIYSSEKEDKKRVSEKCEYDPQGHILIHQYFDEADRLDHWNKFKYDEKGREIEDVDYLGQNKINFTSKKRYNKQDSIEAYMVYHPDIKRDFILNVLYDKNGRNYMDIAKYNDSSVNFWDKYSLNAIGKCLKWERYKPDSTLLHTITYEYDSQGKEIKAISSMGARSEYKYDNFGRKTEEYLFNTIDTIADGKIGYLIYLKTFIYNSSGKIINVVEYNNINNKPKKPNKIYTYEYKFYEY